MLSLKIAMANQIFLFFLPSTLIVFPPNVTLLELVLPFQDPGRARSIRLRQENWTGRGVTLPIPGDRAPAAIHSERKQLGPG